MLNTREPEHAVLAESQKISILALRPTTVWPWAASEVKCTQSHQWGPDLQRQCPRSSLTTCTTPAVSGGCLLMRQHCVNASSQCSTKRFALWRVRGT